MLMLILLGVIILVGIIFLAISRKSSLKIRITALCALALMIITIITCLVLIFGIELGTDSKLVQSEAPVDVQPAPVSNNIALILLIIFILALFFVILMLSLREQKRSGAQIDKDKSRD
jgi:cytochrome bd-type quinol oxidase subunit 2